MPDTLAPTIKVKKLHPDARLPRYSHSGPWGDLAADLTAVAGATLAPTGNPGCTQAVSTGIALELPSTHGALVEDRSGLSLKGLTTLAGVIDPGYRGEVKVIVTNLTPAPFVLAAGDRIAQLRVVQRIEATFEEVAELAEASLESFRGGAGFGSTGI